MAMHKTSGRWRLGATLAVSTAVLWGLLPVALKVVLEKMDPVTATWYRFLVSAIVMAAYVIWKHGPPSLAKMKGWVPVLMALNIFGLAGNYILYALGLNYLSPSINAVVIQVAPIMFLAGGLIIFREKFVFRQYVGIAILICGLGLFFNQRLGELVGSFGAYTIGVIMLIASAASWAVYALAQKQMLETYPSETIMVIIYVGSVIIFSPMAEPGSVSRLDGVQLALLGFCALNTIVAYGCFSESLAHLEASRVSAIIATVPIVTMVSMKSLNLLFPEVIKPEGLNWLSVAGACMVVTGSITSVLAGGGRMKPKPR